MGLERIDLAQVSQEAVEALGLTQLDVTLTSTTALAASIRRAASFLCPTTPRSLIRAVEECLHGLREFTDETQTEITELVDSLVSYGDLLELPADEGTRIRRQLFLGPPAYVLRSPQLALLVGIPPHGAQFVGEDLLGGIEYVGYARFMRSSQGKPIADMLALEGLIELRPDQWLQAPRQVTATELVEFYSLRLDAAGPSGEIEGFEVIDTASRVSYYRGRWRTLQSRDHGRFVARRPQAFGADLWCFALVANGKPIKLIDLPIQNPLGPGADEAWRLQAALDAIAGRPQQLRVRSDGVMSALDFFAPLPSWIRRRLDIVGVQVQRSVGALLSYAIETEEIGAEIRYLSEMMWLAINEESGGTARGY